MLLNWSFPGCRSPMPRPFEVSPEELERDLDAFVTSVHADLQSSFLVLPKGGAFLEYPRFQEAYEHLKQATRNFGEVSPVTVWNALLADSLTLVVVRTILGLTPPEWAELTRTELGVLVEQAVARSLDQRVQLDRDYVSRLAASGTSVNLERLRAMVELACRLISTGAPPVPCTASTRLTRWKGYLLSAAPPTWAFPTLSCSMNDIWVARLRATETLSPSQSGR